MARIDRRAFIGGAGALLAGAAILRGGGRGEAASRRFAVSHTPAEWRRILGPDRYAVLREAATERPFSSPLDEEHRKGTFACAGCALPLFSSATKFDSGTGWPSFWRPMDDAVGTSVDRSWLMVRTEVHCAGCGGHLGHLFGDGPKPTGLRYCINGVALTFEVRL